MELHHGGDARVPVEEDLIVQPGDACGTGGSSAHTWDVPQGQPQLPRATSHLLLILPQFSPGHLQHFSPSRSFSTPPTVSCLEVQTKNCGDKSFTLHTGNHRQQAQPNPGKCQFVLREKPTLFLQNIKYENAFFFNLKSSISL